MGRPVRVVTDSTSYLPTQLLTEYAVGVIALQVAIDGISASEGLTVSPEDVANALNARKSVSTSLPSPSTVRDAVLEAARDGHDVCVIHLSSELSGTYAATERAAAALAAECGSEIAVVDSRQVAMGLGFVVLAAARAAASGADLASVQDAALNAIDDVSVFFLVDTLEHLRRGGRLTAGQAVLGTALAIKPILEVRDGLVVAKEKVRTASKALLRLEELVVETAAGRPVRLAVHHLQAADAAAVLCARLVDRLNLLDAPVVCEVGAVVGAHVGPGLLGAVIDTA